jgi:hypothetical protein
VNKRDISDSAARKKKKFRVVHCAALILLDLTFSAKRSSSSLFKLQIPNKKFDKVGDENVGSL